MGVDEISLGDTIGVATPNQVIQVVRSLSRLVPLFKLALHLHDTRGTALTNVLIGLDCGITTFDSSVGGMGGCPYAPGAAGNLATEDLVYMLNGLGVKTGIDVHKLVDCGILPRTYEEKLPGRCLQACLSQRDKPGLAKEIHATGQAMQDRSVKHGRIGKCSSCRKTRASHLAETQPSSRSQCFESGFA